MIDEFIQFLLTPILAITFQILLILINSYMLKNSTIYKNVQCIIYLIFGLLEFPLIWSIVYQTVLDFTLILFSLCLMLSQTLMNVEFLLKTKKEKK